MASLINDPNGMKRVQFVDGNGERKTVRLGKMTQKAAYKIKVHIEELVSAKRSKHPLSNVTADWIGDLESGPYDRLVRAGLVPSRSSLTLKSFIDGYIETRADVTPATMDNYEKAKKNALEFFHAKKRLRDISPGDADQFRLWLLNTKNLAENTVRRRCGQVKQFLRAAVRQKLIPSNPFEDIASTVRKDKEKEFFVTIENAESVLEQLPDAETRVIFAMARYAGVRIISEITELKWSDINWDLGKIRITSPKTARIGKGERLTPLFPELRPYLMDAFEAASEGAVYVAPGFRSSTASQRLRKHVLKAITAAGLKRWPRLFHTLRSSRQTELAAEYPLHVVCDWLGNTPDIANEHYLQTREVDFQRAVECGAKSGAVRGRTEANGGETQKEGMNENRVIRPNTQECVSVPVHEDAFNGQEWT